MTSGIPTTMKAVIIEEVSVSTCAVSMAISHPRLGANATPFLTGPQSGDQRPPRPASRGQRRAHQDSRGSPKPYRLETCVTFDWSFISSRISDVILVGPRSFQTSISLAHRVVYLGATSRARSSESARLWPALRLAPMLLVSCTALRSLTRVLSPSTSRPLQTLYGLSQRVRSRTRRLQLLAARKYHHHLGSEHRIDTGSATQVLDCCAGPFPPHTLRTY